MAMHLLGDLYQVGGGDITHPDDGACYLIVDPEEQEHVLIECCSPSGWPNLEREVNRLGIEMGRIARIYGTHGHYDHVGGKENMPDIPLYLHENDHAGVLSADRQRTAAFLYSRPFPHIPSVETIEDDYETMIGTTRLTAFHTPGHSPGSMCYLIQTKGEESVLIAGDMLWGCGNDQMGSDMNDWSNSLDRLAAISQEIDYVTFGHGISSLVTNALGKHIALARSSFGVTILPVHGGLMYDPWVASHVPGQL